MTVIARVGWQAAPWRGYDDPSLPEGIWFASPVVIGDASGGTSSAQVLFGDEGDPLSGDIFTVETIEAFISDPTGFLGFWNIIGMAPAFQSSFIDRLGFLQFGSGGAVFGQSLIHGGRGGGSTMPLLPLVLGTRRGTADSLAAFSVGTDNIGVGDSLAVACMGYRWGPRSILAPGGPQRPARSIFGG